MRRVGERGWPVDEGRFAVENELKRRGQDSVQPESGMGKRCHGGRRGEEGIGVARMHTSQMMPVDEAWGRRQGLGLGQELGWMRDGRKEEGQRKRLVWRGTTPSR